MAVLDVFQSLAGTPTDTIAWGHSLGGMITAGLVQENPKRFTAALPMCGVLAGGVGLWNEALDEAFAFNTLLAGGILEVVHITTPTQNFITAEGVLAAAQATPQGRARLALVAALDDLPGWFDPTTPEPARTDYASQQANQFLWLQYVGVPFMFALRAELEFRAGGNPSFNTGVDYARQLGHSTDNAEVQALYAAAGLNLDADLAALDGAARIPADPGALTYLSNNITYNGQLAIPVLTMHTTGDGLVPVEDERAYGKVVHEANDSALWRETFVHRAGHCEFTPAATMAAVHTSELRLPTGGWKDLTLADLNGEAAALGPEFNVIEVNGSLVETPPAFLKFEPRQFLRIFDAFTEEYKKTV